LACRTISFNFFLSVTNSLTIIIIIGTTALSEPRPSLEASASCPYSCSIPQVSLPQLPGFIHHAVHEPILKSFNRFVSRRVLDSPAIASLDFATIFFPEQVVSLASNPQQSSPPLSIIVKSIQLFPLFDFRNNKFFIVWGC
jgi:hypothetical protein